MFISTSDAEQVITELRTAAPGVRSWLLCLPDQQAERIPDLLAMAEQHQLSLYGALFPGILYGNACHDSGVLAIPLPADSEIAVARLDAEGTHWLQAPSTSRQVGFSSGMIFVDCLSPNIDAFLEEIYDRYGTAKRFVGAGCGFHDLRKQPALFTPDGLMEQAALMICFPQAMTAQVRHGWHRVAGPFVASRSAGNVLQELNWASAGNFYRDQVALLNQTLRDKPVYPDLNSTYPLCIAKEGSEDIVRDPMYITEDDDVVVLSDVMENSVMYLAYGNRESLIAAARSAVIDCGEHDDVVQCFVSDCYSRILMLGDDFNQELDVANATLNETAGIHLEGVLALGEVAGDGLGKLEFYNKTFVVGLLHLNL